ncbi:8-amino-7-oxononanoate synthase [Thalassoglobus polymorphus]|uniref:8-amino-7-ketopelargonate synthase n=1 Tax=Thalassoglobus polymorphus TaxID=2527994 RepID=A0A517QS76_9PLAN|nr:8-amino-7-oxononanoate synthase [Thalassoglobus polymorphus]QDT34478.1 8-amino-7-oxononanoate synthase 2 [Thalassoglobus polymorphus]
MTSPFDWIADELHSLEEQSLIRSRRKVQPLSGGRCEVDGQKLWNFSGNDYLGLADDPIVTTAVIDELKNGTGIGARASALVTGRTPLHSKLEKRLAEFKGTEAAILFPTGFAANFGAVTSLVGPEDVVFCDRLNHASLIDGARHSRARFRVYPHCELSTLRKELEKSGNFRRRLIVTDSLFSMDGDVAPLSDLAKLAEEYDAMLLVDEAHATGVFGERGSGLLEAQQVKSENILSVGTLSKAVGAQGGFVAGSKNLCDWLWSTSRTSMFSTALSPVLCAAALASLERIQSQPRLRRDLLSRSENIKLELQSQGWTVPESVIGPIIPVIIGEAERTIHLASELQALGVLVAAIRPPTVSKGTARLRISISSAHAEAGLRCLLESFHQLRGN